MEANRDNHSWMNPKGRVWEEPLYIVGQVLSVLFCFCFSLLSTITEWTLKTINDHALVQLGPYQVLYPNVLSPHYREI